MSFLSLSYLDEQIIKGIADELEMTLRWNRFNKTTLQQERKFKPVLRATFTAQQEDVLERVADNPPPEQRGIDLTYVKQPSQIYEPWLFDPDEWQIILEDAARPFIEASMEEGAAFGIADIGQRLGVTIALDFDVKDPRIAKIIEDKLHTFSFEVNKETTRLLKAEFREAIKKGESIPKIEKRVKKVFGFTKKSRVNAIARTEIGGAYSAGNFESMVESGVVATKKWINSRDAKVRHSHRKPLDGEVVPVNELFSNGLRFPRDWFGALAEFINCRCTMMAEDFVI